jgi:hypothetical protein
MVKVRRSFSTYIFVLTALFSGTAHADAYEKLKNFYESASEPADPTDIDLGGGSVDSPQKCFFAHEQTGEVPQPARLMRLEGKFESQVDYGPLFMSQVPMKIDFLIETTFSLTTTPLTEGQVAESAKTIKLEREKTDLIYEYYDPRYSKTLKHKIRRNDKAIAIRIELYPGSLSNPVYYAYCFRR